MKTTQLRRNENVTVALGALVFMFIGATLFFLIIG